MAPKGRPKASAASATKSVGPKVAQVSYSDPLWEYNNRTSPSDVDPRLIPRMAELARSRFPARQEHGVLLLRKVLSIDSDPPIQEVLATGVEETLVKVLRTTTSTNVQFEACWALSNLCSGTHEQLLPVQKAGVIPAAADLFKTTTSPNCLEQAAWTLGNICGDSPECRDEVLAQDIFPTMRRQLLEPVATLSLSIQRIIVWLLAQTVRLPPKPSIAYMKEVCSLCAELLKVPSLDVEVFADVLWTLAYVSEAQGGTEVVHGSGSVELLLDTLRHNPAASILSAVTRLLGAFAQSSSEELSAYVLGLPDFDGIFNLFLTSPKPTIQKDGFWCLSNLAAGGRKFATELARKELMRAAMTSVATGAVTAVRVEAMYLILNVISEVERSVVKELIGKGGLLDSLSAAVASGCQDRAKFQAVTLETLTTLSDIAVRDATAAESDDDGLLSVLTSTLRDSMISIRHAREDFDTLCTVFFDSSHPSYYRIIHPKKTTRYAIPEDLIRATDITDRIGSFVSHGQLIPLTNRHRCPLRSFHHAVRSLPQPASLAAVE